MPNAQNKEMLASIKEDLDGVSAMWVVDYRGLTVKEMQQLRRDIRETGSVMKVYKNTLVHLALAEAELPTLDDMLAGPSAFVFSGNDVAASAKALKTFAKANENLEIKGGLMEGAAVSGRRGGGHRFSALSRAAHGSDRRCYLRRRSRSGYHHQRCAARFGPGRQGRGRAEGSCLTARAA